jgi:hypothetical protein
MMNYYKQSRKAPEEVENAVSLYQRTIIKDLTDGIFIPVKDDGCKQLKTNFLIHSVI